MKHRLAFLAPLCAIVLMGQACPRLFGGPRSGPQPKTELEYAAEFLMDGSEIKPKTHKVGVTKCPDRFDGLIRLSGPAGQMWRFDPMSVPDWLTLDDLDGTFGDMGVDVNLIFNCNITKFNAHTEHADLKFQGSQDGTRWGDYGSLPIDINIMPRP